MFYKVVLMLCEFVQQYNRNINSGCSRTISLAQWIDGSVEVLRNFVVRMTNHLYKLCIVSLNNSIEALF
jgi:hypothetical protein